MNKRFFMPALLLTLTLTHGQGTSVEQRAVAISLTPSPAEWAKPQSTTATVESNSLPAQAAIPLPITATASVAQAGTSASTEQGDIYVSPAGSDSNPGSERLPFRTIGRAASVATAGSTVHVTPGQYIGEISTYNAGRADAPVHFVSTIQWGAHLLGQGKDAVWTNHGDFTIISGFDVSGSGRIGILNLGSHTLIEGNHVHHLTVSGGCTANGGAGIDNGNFTGSNGDIIGNIIHDIGSPGSCNGVHGIYSSNHGGHIMNNLVYRVAAYGIHLWHAATAVTIANNTLFANGSSNMGGGIILGNGDGPDGTVLNHTKVINNIVYDNPATSIKEFCYPRHDCTGANNTVANNLVFKNGQPISLRRGRARNTITADPQFLDYRPDGSGNYGLQVTSPALAKGVSMDAVSRITIGVTKKNASRSSKPDIGANLAQRPIMLRSPPSPTTAPKS
ncbi:DUF1565 domain-containing protein [Massilia sp. PWRC2]|uniref:DUF1565 domain-containing protein n=1 Tax=Massilia sp. PWRC2 TaxID=2804626 RepID=UPI003CEB5CD3